MELLQHRKRKLPWNLKITNDTALNLTISLKDIY